MTHQPPRTHAARLPALPHVQRRRLRPARANATCSAKRRTPDCSRPSLRRLGPAALVWALAACTGSPYGQSRPDPETPSPPMPLAGDARLRLASTNPPSSRLRRQEERPKETSVGLARAKREAEHQKHVERRDQAVAAIEERRAALPPSTVDILNTLEQGIIDEVNRLRTDPAAYSEDLQEFRSLYDGSVVTVPGYLAVRTREGVAAVDDALQYVESIDPVPPVKRSLGLTQAARAHAFWLGEQGSLGHGNGEDSVSPHVRLALYGRVEGMYAENIGAVYRDPRLMILELLVDDGVESRVHRFNLLGGMFTLIGAGCAPHAKYDVVCVIDFAEGFHEEGPATAPR